MKLVPLSSVCSQTRRQIPAGERADLRYIGLESIEAGTGQLASGELSKTPEAPRASSFHFTDQHVLYSKLRPYLNKVWVPDFEGKSSTELVPLLPSDTLDRRYLAYFLRSPGTVQAISARTVGARMPRADMDFLLSLQIPLPSIEEQRRIVDLLSRAEGIVRLRREAQAKGAEIIPALFLDMFGDPASNPNGWPIMPLGDLLVACNYGTSKRANSDGAGVPILRMGNVNYDGSLDLVDIKHVELDKRELAQQLLLPGDLLFNRTNSKDLVGKTGLWDGRWPATAASYFIRFRTDAARVKPVFIWALLNSRHMKRVLFQTARGAIGQSNINMKELKSLVIPVPPLKSQETFAASVERMNSINNQQNTALDSAHATFEALLHRLFAIR